MPQSVIIYTSRDAFSALTLKLKQAFQAESIKPFTVSFPQKTRAEQVRVRITELRDGAALPFILEQAEKAVLTFASSADKDVRATTYENLIEDADQFKRIIPIQLTSATIVEVLGRPEPFPVISAVIQRYIDVWNIFSAQKILAADTVVRHTSIIDFKISSVPTTYGAGVQGWLVVEIEKGRTEQEIRLLNALVDFSFYSGTGLHTEEGLGQTKRIEEKDWKRTSQVSPSG